MKKILIIEDERILGEMYRDKFQKSGFQISLVDNAEDGIKFIAREKPDLVLLDILLPGADGIYFLKELRKEPKLSSIPVIAFSNYDSSEARKQVKKLGGKDYLIKTDFTPQEIIDKVKNYL